MLKMFYLLFLSALLTSNGLSTNFFSNKTLDFSYQNVNHVAESVFYTESVIGTEPNDSPINGFNQDISKFSQNISYSTANVITYNLNSGITNFENFNPDSYQIRTYADSSSNS